MSLNLYGYRMHYTAILNYSILAVLTYLLGRRQHPRLHSIYLSLTVLNSAQLSWEMPIQMILYYRTLTLAEYTFWLQWYITRTVSFYPLVILTIKHRRASPSLIITLASSIIASILCAYARLGVLPSVDLIPGPIDYSIYPLARLPWAIFYIQLIRELTA